MDNEMYDNEDAFAHSQKKRIGVTMFFALLLSLLIISTGGWFMWY